MPDDLESCSYSGPSNICLCPAASHVDNCFKNVCKEYICVVCNANNICVNERCLGSDMQYEM